MGSQLYLSMSFSVIQYERVWRKRGTEVAACVLKQAERFGVDSQTVDSLTVRKCINHIPCQSASWYNLVDIVTHFYAPRACFCFHHDQVVTAFICVAPCDCNVTSLLLFTFLILKCHVTKDWSAFLNCWVCTWWQKIIIKKKIYAVAQSGV